MNTRNKKKANARIITIRTQWAKINEPHYVGSQRYFTELLNEPLKSNPNNRAHFYMATKPDNMPINFDNEDWLGDDVVDFEEFDPSEEDIII